MRRNIQYAIVAVSYDPYVYLSLEVTEMFDLTVALLAMGLTLLFGVVISILVRDSSVMMVPFLAASVMLIMGIGHAIEGSPELLYFALASYAVLAVVGLAVDKIINRLDAAEKAADKARKALKAKAKA